MRLDNERHYDELFTTKEFEKTNIVRLPSLLEYWVRSRGGVSIDGCRSQRPKGCIIVALR